MIFPVSENAAYLPLRARLLVMLELWLESLGIATESFLSFLVSLFLTVVALIPSLLLRMLDAFIFLFYFSGVLISSSSNSGSAFEERS
jgi:hypothetical protein